MEPKFLLIVKVPRGIVIRDTPRPESQGGRPMRSIAVGAQIYAYGIHNINGVEYARLVPRDPTRQEWIRVAEADHSIEYVDVINLDSNDSTGELVDAITLLATAVRDLARKT